MELIDSHCHLDTEAFLEDLPEILQRSSQQSVMAFVVPAIDFSAWPRLRRLAAQYPQIKPAYGLHPLFQAQHQKAHLDALLEWLQNPACVAVGECGLDFFMPDAEVKWQEFIFIEHIRLAKQTDKPLIIHARKATERVIQLLKQQGSVRGVVHSYSGSLEQARQLVSMGFMLGIAGAITYPRSNRVRALVQEIPLEFLLIETDAPDQALYGAQGQRNTPSALPRIAQAIAEIKTLSLAQVAAQTTQNAKHVFGITTQQKY